MFGQQGRGELTPLYQKRYNLQLFKYRITSVRNTVNMINITHTNTEQRSFTRSCLCMRCKDLKRSGILILHNRLHIIESPGGHEPWNPKPCLTPLTALIPWSLVLTHIYNCRFRTYFGWQQARNRGGRPLGLKTRNMGVQRVYDDKIHTCNQYIVGLITYRYSEAER